MTEVEKHALLPCPFCGCSPQPVPQNTHMPAKLGGYTKVIWCENCRTEGPERQTSEEATAAWNRRLTPSKATQAQP